MFQGPIEFIHRAGGTARIAEEPDSVVPGKVINDLRVVGDKNRLFYLFPKCITKR